MQTFHIPATDARVGIAERLKTVICNLPMVQHTVEIKEYKRTRTDPQNRFLWATYAQILKVGGSDMEGWSRNDLHDFFLMDFFGTETYEVFGRKRVRAVRRSSKLNKQEFSEYVAHIQKFMAERGVYLEDPA